MEDKEVDGRATAREWTIRTLDHVPIDAEFLPILTRILTKHGATLEETDEPVPPNIKGDLKMYNIHFPPGTKRSDGLVMQRSYPFVILFPDNYTLHGAALWPLTRLNSDPHINGLMLPPAEIKQFR